MLGNWSFGDYFKEEAIPWAWELLTKVWGLPPDRLWVTVFGGDTNDGLPADADAERIWIEKAGIAPARVLRFGRKDNFWEMGDTGPCGPCTEIHIDRGGAGTNPLDGRDKKIGVNAGNERFIELWNNVFMEFNRLDDGSLRPLPARSVDTGMGFERVLSVLQHKRSNYDTDLFAPIFARIGELAGKRYGAHDERVDVAFRVCADHMRAVTSAMSDGALPTNTGRGYVLRRLIRRAARFGRQDLAIEEPFLFELTSTVASVLGDTFPEMRARNDHVRAIVEEEEKSFNRTLGRGLVRFEDLREKVVQSKSPSIPGDAAFELYATYGFPRDLVELMARERGLAVDAAGWEKAESAHQQASKSEGKFKQLLSAEQLEHLKPTASTYHDDGEKAYRLETSVQLYQRDDEGSAKLVLAASPFYPEGGGQVGDSGTISDAAGRWKFTVEDTRRVGNVVVHSGRAANDAPHAIAANSPVVAEVDRVRRERTRKNHTATHLLHRALKEVLGAHVGQQGSYVGPDRLRFDFSHPRGVTAEDLERIEAIVNEQVFANRGVTTTVEDLDAAKARGVVAMFGEKYDQRVRVLDVGGWSTELCGGTHVRAAGDIGPFVIVSERAIQAGVRRIEALTGRAAVEEIQRQRRILREAAQSLKSSPDEIAQRIDALQTQLKDAKKKSAAGSQTDVAGCLARLRDGLKVIDGVSCGAFAFPELDQKNLRDLVDRARALSPKMAFSVFGREGDRVPHIHVVQGIAAPSRLAAGDLAKSAVQVLGGGGGGKPDLAQGQGLNPDAIEAAVEKLGARIAAGLSAP
jgi:alanyl-tRNA synthetase